MWTILVISVFIVAIGVKIISTSISKKKRCTVEVWAKIVNVKKIKCYDTGDYSVPSYSYWYNGTEYVSKTGNFMSIIPHEEGETLRIRVNPDDPNEIYDPSVKDTSKISGSFTIIIGVVCFIVVLVKILNSISITIK